MSGESTLCYCETLHTHSAVLVFDMLRIDISATFYIIPNLIQSNVALERIGDFLYNVGVSHVLLSVLPLTSYF